MARLGAQLGQHQDVPHLRHRGQVHHAAHVQHQHKAAVLPMAGQNVPDLRVGQQNIAADGVAVGSLAGHPGEDVHSGLPLPVEGQVIGGLVRGAAHGDNHHVLPPLPGLLLHGLHKGHLGLGPGLVVAVHPRPGGDGEAGGGQPLLGGDEIAGVHLAGAGAALEGAACAAAVEGDFSGLFQRESAVGFQQHGALGAVAADELAVFALIVVPLHGRISPIYQYFMKNQHAGFPGMMTHCNRGAAVNL